MTRSTVKRLTKPLDEPEREFWRCRKAALRSHQNESLAIARRNLFDDEASSSYNTGAKPPMPPKTLREHSHPNSSSFLNPITFPTEQTGRIIDSRDIRKLDQFARFRFDSLTEEEGWNRIEEYVQYQDDPWDDVRDIYDDPSLLRFYQNDNTLSWGNNKRKEKGEDGPEWIIRSKFEDELANFMLEKKSHTKGIGDMLVQYQPAPRPSILYQPSKSSNLPFPSRLKKQKKDDEDERLLSIFKQIHINLPFLKAMIHMPLGAKVLKDLLSHNEKLDKSASSVKLSKECSAIIQRSLPQKEGDLGSFTLPCLIGPLAVKNALVDLGASINLMPHSIFRRLGISKLKPTKMSIQLVDQSIKYPIGVCENLLVKISKFIFPVDFVVLEMDEDELILIILGRPFLATERAEQWVDTVNHDGEWTKDEEGDDPNEVLAVPFYPRTEPVEPLEWKALKNRLIPSSVEPPKLELKELPGHLELLEVLQNHKVAIAWSIADIKGIDSSFYTHKILMEDEFKPSVQPQRRVNPNIKEVVPKKGGMTVERNEKDELIPQQIVTGEPPYRFNNLTRRLTIEEMLAKFIDEGKREHEEMEIFIKEFRTTNELLLKIRSNLSSELKIEVNKLSKVVSNVLILKNEVKGVTTRGGMITSEATRSKKINETRINKNEPPRFEQDVQEKPHDDGVENKSLRTNQPLVKPQQSSIPFPNRVRKEKEEALQQKFFKESKTTRY
ncbi:DNA-directed DNA polymerase [Tanacetum coccineum]